MAAEGVLNQLGRPQLSLFEVLAREAIQNSWDARREQEVVQFSIDAYEVTGPELRNVIGFLGANLPEEGLPLRKSLASEPLRFLVISDAGTTGLGGPTRADI